MTSLAYSNDAQNVLAKFYRSEVIVFVEGDDDVQFWDILFDKFYPYKVEIISVGGRAELNDHIERLKGGVLDAIVAIDTDFSIFRDELVDHPRVLRTAGYSIENSLITGLALMKIARRSGKLTRRQAALEEFEHWLQECLSALECLVVHDILDQGREEPIGVVGDNGVRFLVEPGGEKISSQKIKNYLKSLGLELEPVLASQLQEAVAAKNARVEDFIRGHFLYSVVLRFICQYIRRKRSKVSLSSAAFFGALVFALEGSLNDEHPHFRHYEESFERLCSAV